MQYCLAHQIAWTSSKQMNHMFSRIRKNDNLRDAGFITISLLYDTSLIQF